MIQGILNQVQLTWRLMFDQRIPAWQKAIVIVPIIYVLSPFDFIPDFVLGLGQLDDIGLVLAAMRLFESVVPEYIVQEHRSNLSSGRSQAPTSNGYHPEERERMNG
ncbi:MAG: DUF1232 domain-containing protein [Anaerolineae bacterium]|jgi:uncharacterized membrane protein YkvA (DUF1232 family)|uniref:YkvA family protein n=1 Tax=Candidatus Flexifilum breve TaxID=3140694 RepID=UPI001AC7F52D|nr:DUF1232 domain-containing protein [Chloroflexota bacterium]MBK9749126.1 DUF1232 domain-containing protein [Chloroflexota bacterium]MBN8636791.1 DUF1232 domain-containing protein [Anaerolineae bacterium]